MKTVPIIFSTNDVRSTLIGKKTSIRMIVKPQPVLSNGLWELGQADWSEGVNRFHPVPCHTLYNRMPCEEGDILYVCESWCNVNKPEWEPDYYYYADTLICEDYDSNEWDWHQPSDMPADAARIFLKVTDVFIDRLMNITLDEIQEEGTLHHGNMQGKPTHLDFQKEWDSNLAEEEKDIYNYDSNPWVWVIKFEVEKITDEES